MLKNNLKRALVSVINDLSTDQRVDKVCKTLKKCGYNVLLVGRKKKNSLPMENRMYKTHRMKLIFEKEAVFYAEFNIRLFFFLLFHKSDILISNDLDTLLPNFLISKIKRIPLVYDSHEYFIGVPELEKNGFARKIWLAIEKWIFPKLKHVFTVNQSIAELYQKQYNININIVRNIPLKRLTTISKTREELGLPMDKKIIILQGAGINIDRGVEELVQSMQWIKNSILLIIGNGDIIESLKTKTDELQLNEKVKFINRLTYNELINYTANADLGLTVDKDSNLNYKFSLPNKLFDYISAGIPVLASNLPEVKRIVEKYKVGEILYSHKPEIMAQTIENMLNNKEKLLEYKANTKIAATELCWENEEIELNKVYNLYN